MSKRVKDNLDRGLWVNYGAPEDDYMAVADRQPAQYYNDREFWPASFNISYHKGQMPMYDSQTFYSLEDLIETMRRVEPDLRKWRLCEVD